MTAGLPPIGPQRERTDVILTTLHVQIPREQRILAEPLWKTLREDGVGAETAARLRANGIRVGVGNRQWWSEVKSALEEVPRRRVMPMEPVRLPAGFPLALELDLAPRDQILFCLNADGVFSGENWPLSRNVLRLTQMPVPEDRVAVRLSVYPEVRQRLPGWRWVRGEAGLTQLPNYSGREYSDAGFTIDLEPGSFLVIAPGEETALKGLIGSAFLCSENDGQVFESYIFIRVDPGDGERTVQ